jgi:hypothetical protein
MNIVYNSENYYVCEYPAQQGYEVVDKTTHRGTFFQGDVALKFRDAMLRAVGEDASAEHVDEFLASFDILLNLPAVYH